MIEKIVCEKILTVGPDYRARGGMSSVLKIYTSFFQVFNFVSTHDTSRKSLWQKLMLQCTALFHFLKFMCCKQIRIVHLHTADYTSFYRKSLLLLIAHIFSKKTIIHLHGHNFEEFYLSHRKYARFILQRADTIIVIASYWRNFLLQERIYNNLIMIGNPIPLQTSDILEYRQKKHNKLLHVVFIGKIDEDKGILDIVKMLIQNKVFFTGKIFVDIAGIGHEVNKLKQLIRTEKLEQLIAFHDWADPEKKRELYLAADLALQPSHRESFGMGILEAMSYALPVITCNTGGIPDLVKNNENGILIFPQDISAMKEAIDRILNNPELRLEWGKRSYWLAAQFSIKMAEEKLYTVYQKLLES